ncbi:MAG: PAS domain-containing protein [Sterolibacterium sp.]|jgi:two-component system nitrogen regulation sensor histidine kinase GlnL|nr:PAS domain-containing protein [Sterolibacterium sp.]
MKTPRHIPDADPLYAGLSLLSTAVILLDEHLCICHVNPAAENLFASSQRQLLAQPIGDLLGQAAELGTAFTNALEKRWSYTGYNIAVPRADAPALHLDCTVTPVDTESAVARLLLEFRPIDQQLKVVREERLAEQQQVSRELIRNLAHEIKNPLGGIRGSAQLLEHELQTLDNADELREYTQVIIHEADRLQDLMQRLLSSHRVMRPVALNLHEVLERVRRLILAEFTGIEVRRDYDTSLPEITADREQLIQAILNIARNAAQAMRGAAGNGDDNVHGHGNEITLRTRAVRQATLAKRRHRLGVEIRIIDNGPGIPDSIRETIFYPLVTGRSDGSGSGLGLTLAQSFIHQHHGSIEVDSRPGYTCFTLCLPIYAEPSRQGSPL